VSRRMGVLHAWTAQLQQLLPGERITRVRVLALFALGMIWAGTARVNRTAAALPLGVRVPSTERRRRRFLRNRLVSVATLWDPLLPALLRPWAGGAVSLVFDPTPLGRDWTVLWIGIVVHRRVLPLAWCLVPQQEAWPEKLAELFPALVAPIAAALPPGCTVTLLGDRGVTGPTLIDTARDLGWEVVLRLNVGPKQAHRLRLEDGTEWRLWDWVETVGSGWSGPVQILKGAGWRTGFLTIHRDPEAKEWWILFSTQPGGRMRVRQYRKRSRVEATFADGKRRGWDLERSHVRDQARLERLLLVWHLALWWLHALGRHVIHRGDRARFDRTDRRDASVIRLGWSWLQHQLAADKPVPLLFRLTDAGWVARGTP
jgi:hypothetical protein